jgi:hypothetical protein
MPCVSPFTTIVTLEKCQYIPELPNIVEATYTSVLVTNGIGNSYTPKLVSPDPNHTPEWDHHRHNIRNDKHLFCTDLPVSLDVPESEGASGGCDRLCETEVGVLKEREREFIILTDRYECSGRV